MKIYTKTGDDGTTGLYGGGRVGKDSPRIEACGSVDETNCALGVARAAGTDARTDQILHALQRGLFTLGADLATPRAPGRVVPRVTPADVGDVERWIDEIDGRLPRLTAFILPGGSASAAQLHLARAVCRRAERAIVALAGLDEIGDPAAVYVNRVSDLLFVLARFEAARSDSREEEWHPNPSERG